MNNTSGEDRSSSPEISQNFKTGHQSIDESKEPTAGDIKEQPSKEEASQEIVEEKPEEKVATASDQLSS